MINPLLKYKAYHQDNTNIDDIFTEINDKIIEPNNYKKLLPDNEDKKSIIDWGHHIVHYVVLIYSLMLYLFLAILIISTRFLYKLILDCYKSIE